MHFYFIRHAQSANNVLFASGQGALVRTHDPPLTELGRRQAARLADYLSQADPYIATDEGDSQNRAGFGLTHLYCSLMVRSVATGSIVAERLGLPLQAWLDWHEEGGLYREGESGERLLEAGPGRADFTRDYPGLVLPDTLGEAGWWNQPFEEPAARPARARRELSELRARHGPDDRVAIISHGGFYNHIIGALMDVLPPYSLSHLMNNTGITRVALLPQGQYLVYQNHCDHLPQELVTY